MAEIAREARRDMQKKWRGRAHGWVGGERRVGPCAHSLLSSLFCCLVTRTLMPLLVTASTARPVGVLPAVPAIAATCVVVKRRAGRDGVSPRPKSEREARRRAASLAGRGALSLPQPHHAPPPLAWLTPFRPGRRHPRVAPAPLPLSRSPPSLSPPPTTHPPPRRPGRPARLHPGPPCPRRHRRLGRQVPGLRLLPRGSGRGRVPGEDA